MTKIPLQIGDYVSSHSGYVKAIPSIFRIDGIDDHDRDFLTSRLKEGAIEEIYISKEWLSAGQFYKKATPLQIVQFKNAVR